MTAIKSLGILLVAVLLGCSDKKAGNEQHLEIDTPDAAVLANLSPTDLRNELSSAKAGDVAAAKRLYEYYSTHGRSDEARYWSAWLVRHNDPDSLAAESEDRFRHARSLDDTDPKKLELLAEALSLNARRPQTDPKTVAMINGRQVDVTDDLKRSRLAFGESIQQEYRRVRALHSHEAQRPGAH